MPVALDNVPEAGGLDGESPFAGNDKDPIKEVAPAIADVTTVKVNN